MAIPSDAHLKAFGLLIHRYAMAETGLKLCLAGMLDIHPRLVFIMAEPYTAVSLRTVVKSVAKEHIFPGDGLERLVQIIGDLKPYGPIRNAIAHTAWTDGTRPNSIKPRNVSIRDEKAVFRGDDPDEEDWTAEEIWEAGVEIAKVNQRLLSFNQDMGFMARIDRHTEAQSDATESDDGNSNKES